MPLSSADKNKDRTATHDTAIIKHDQRLFNGKNHDHGKDNTAASIRLPPYSFNRNCLSMTVGRTIVIGGGAAGLMAAGRAAERGGEVLLLEKMERTGRKIGISGKGRCNLGNSAALPDFLSHFGKNGNFLRQCFQQFFTASADRFF